jgi:hypothetical protein
MIADQNTTGSDARTPLRYRYEVCYEVSPTRHREYDRWVSEALIDWLERPEVEAFQAYRSETDRGHELKLAFQFEDREAWATFVESEVHASNIEELSGLTISLTEQSWTPSLIPLDTAGPADGG